MGARRRRLEAERKLMAQVPPPSLCGALKRNGEPCGRPAGWGTENESGPCKHHGGATPAHEVAAIKGEVKNLATPFPVTPGQAMAGVLHLAAGKLMYTSERVGQLSEDELFVKRKAEIIEHPDGSKEVTYEMLPNKWLAYQDKLMFELAKISKLAADAGINERMADLAEQQTQMIATLLTQVAEDLDLSPSQKAALGPAVRRRLTLVQSQATEFVEDAEVVG